MAVVYLLHFHEPFRHARHYLGYSNHLTQRLEQHRAGSGARLTAVVLDHGIGFELVRTWRGGRALERTLKRRHSSPSLCPLCEGPLSKLHRSHKGRERQRLRSMRLARARGLVPFPVS